MVELGLGITIPSLTLVRYDRDGETPWPQAQVFTLVRWAQDSLYHTYQSWVIQARGCGDYIHQPIIIYIYMYIYIYIYYCWYFNLNRSIYETLLKQQHRYLWLWFAHQFLKRLKRSFGNEVASVFCLKCRCNLFGKGKNTVYCLWVPRCFCVRNAKASNCCFLRTVHAN